MGTDGKNGQSASSPCSFKRVCSFTRVESGGYSLRANEEEIPSMQRHSETSKSPDVRLTVGGCCCFWGGFLFLTCVGRPGRRMLYCRETCCNWKELI